MSLNTIKANIKTALEAVTGIGIVHDYIRNWEARNTNFFTFFKTTDDKINGWQITRQSSSETSINQNNINYRRHNILIFGFMGEEDESATEKTFQTLVEDVCTKLRVEAKQPNPLSGAAWRMGWPQVSVLELRKLNGRNVHATEINLWVDEYIQGF